MKKAKRRLLVLILAMSMVIGTAVMPAYADPAESGENYVAEENAGDSEAALEEETEAPAESETAPESESVVEPETAPESESAAESETSPESESVVEPETPTESESEAESETTAESETPAESESETEAPEETTAELKNGLKKESGYYRYYEDGVKVKSAWRTVEVKGTAYKYYFNSKGNAVTGLQKIKSTYYVFKTNGRLAQPSKKSVVTVDGTKYLVSTAGKACKGWDSAKTYYFGKKYVPLTGYQAISNKIYYFKSSGKIDSAKSKKLKAACKYEKSMKDLYALIGKPKKAKYYSGGCYGPGKDGVLTYKNFIVYTYKEGSKEIFMGVDPR